MSYRPLETGTYTVPAATLQTSFVIPHGLITPPKFCSVAPANTLTAVAISWTWDATNIMVSVNVLGGLTGLVVFNWLAVG